MNKATNQGFTLLEVLLALAILAALGVGLTLTLSQTLDARKQVTVSRQESIERLTDFLNRADKQLSQLVARQAQETARPLNRQPLTLQNNNQELYWVAAGNWVLPLSDYATRLRLWRLNFDKDKKLLSIEASGLLDAGKEQEWTLVDQLEEVSELSFSFYRNKAWQPTLRGSFPKGIQINLTWQGEDYHRLVLLPEIIQLRSANPRQAQQDGEENAEDGSQAQQQPQRPSRRLLRRRNRNADED